MAALVPYVFEGRTLRSLDVGGQPWFVAGDAADFLGHATAKDLTRSLDEDEKGRHSVPTLGGEQDVSIVSEPGLYRAIVQRRATSAISEETRAFIARFQRWVFHDVLPAIRSTGRFIAVSSGEPTRHESVSVRRGPVTEARHTFGSRAAGSLWLSLGLPVVPEMREGDPQSSFGFTYTAVPSGESRSP